MALLDLKNYFLFVAFFNFYPIVSIDKVQLSEYLCLIQSV